MNILFILKNFMKNKRLNLIKYEEVNIDNYWNKWSRKQKWEKEQINSKAGSFIKDIILTWVWLWKEESKILFLKK